MKKITGYSFDNNYKVRSHVAVLIMKIVVAEIVLASVSFLLNSFMFSSAESNLDPKINFFIRFLFLGVSLIIFIYLLLSWNYEYYIISPHSISSNSRIILRKTQNIDVPGIRSIIVNQGLFGRIFNYGTLTLESPLLKENFLIKNVPSPSRHAGLIEKARLEAIEKAAPENIIIAKEIVPEPSSQPEA